MNVNRSSLLKIAGISALLIATFYLGYFTGSRNHSYALESIKTFTPSDMGRAFGSVKPFEHESHMQEPTAKSLSGLVEGLEKKVAANPDNIDQQLLLAQTYNELDNRKKSIELLQGLNKRVYKNAQIKITLATILMSGTNTQELKQAAKLFDEAIQLKPETASMARLYQGEINVKLDKIKQ